MPPKKRAGGDDDDQFDNTESGAAKCEPAKASSIKKGDYLMIKGKPCKCVDTTTSKTGKHGGAKCHITGLDIFTEKKVEFIIGSTCDVDVPNVVKRDLMVTEYDKADGQITGMNEDGTDETFKIHNEEIKGKIDEIDFDAGTTYIITVMSAMDNTDVIAIKEEKN